MKWFILFFTTIMLYGFPHIQHNQFVTQKVVINLKTKNKKIEHTVIARLSAIHEDLIIKQFYTQNSNHQLTFPNVVVYPDIRFYELAIIYQGITYFQNISPQQLFKEHIEIPLYQQGNRKKNLTFSNIDLIYEQSDKTHWITEEITINNSGQFTYSPLLPQKKPGIIHALPKGVTEIQPLFNLSPNNYILKDGYILLKLFLKPGQNHISYRYQIPHDEIFNYTTQNEIALLRVILPNPSLSVQSHFLKIFENRKSISGDIKIAIAKNVVSKTTIDLSLQEPPPPTYPAPWLYKLIQFRFPLFPLLLLLILVIYQQKNLYFSTTHGKEDRSLTGNDNE